MSWLGANTKQQGGAPAPAVTGWQRPTDWLPMPVDAPNKIAILTMVRDTTGEYAALKIVCVGGYTVDWGDGIIDNVASGIAAEHQYLYTDTNLDGTLCTRGYKQAMIVITPQSTGDITEIYLNIRHSHYTVTGVGTPFLDVQINAPSCTILQSYHSNSSCRYIERWNIIAVGSISSMYQMFNNNFSVQQYIFPASFGSVATSMSYMFNNNFSVQQYIFPASFGSVATSMSYMFYGNYSVQQYIFPASFGSVATDMGSMFYGNYSVQQYIFPASFGSVATNMYYMFNNNFSVQQYTFPASFGSVATNMANMFSGNSSTKTITNLEAAVSVTLIGLLETPAIVAVFNSLPTVTGKTITLTGLLGLAGLTAADRLIATNKGWTVTP